MIEDKGWKDKEQFLLWLKDEFVQAPEKDDEFWKLLEPKKEEKKVEKVEKAEEKPIEKPIEKPQKKQKSKKSSKKTPMVDKMKLAETPKENNHVKKTTN